MPMLVNAKRLIPAVLAIGLAAVAIHRPALAAPPADKVLLAPHRAVYDLKLSKSHGSRGIQAVRGRILYDFSGNACDGYELQFRQVSELNSGEGKAALSDLRSTTWEDGAAKKFRFNSENLLNDNAHRQGRRPCRTQCPGGRGQPEQAEGQDLRRSARRGVSDRAHAPHHRRRARGQEHPGISGL